MATPFPRLTPAQFGNPANLAVCLFGLPNRRLQPERYVQYALKCIKKIIFKNKALQGLWWKDTLQKQ
jgi:hypothetical protein